jgi:hypothetical protein
MYTQFQNGNLSDHHCHAKVKSGELGHFARKQTLFYCQQYHYRWSLARANTVPFEVELSTTSNMGYAVDEGTNIDVSEVSEV